MGGETVTHAPEAEGGASAERAQSAPKSSVTREGLDTSRSLKLLSKLSTSRGFTSLNDSCVLTAGVCRGGHGFAFVLALHPALLGESFLG